MAWTHKWLQFSRLGNLIDGLFLPMKVPLRDSLNRGLLADDRFGWDDVLRKEPHVGLVIDLTKTMKYYDSGYVRSRHVDYVKIWMEGHGSLPPQSQVRQFVNVVDAFLAKDSSRGRVIAVHCTHGLNRTGYMICKYLIQRRGMPPHRAMQMFESCRGHRMERPAYVTDLQATRPLPAHDPDLSRARVSHVSNDFSNRHSAVLTPDREHRHRTAAPSRSRRRVSPVTQYSRIGPPVTQYSRTGPPVTQYRRKTSAYRPDSAPRRRSPESWYSSQRGEHANRDWNKRV